MSMERRKTIDQVKEIEEQETLRGDSIRGNSLRRDISALRVTDTSLMSKRHVSRAQAKV